MSSNVFHEFTPARPLDALDRRIVGALQIDGRASWRTIAEVLDEPERTITRRGNRLLESGVVRVVGKHIRGNGVIVRAKCAPGMARVTAQALAARPDTIFTYLLTGTWSCVAELFCPPGQIGRLVADDLPGTPGMLSCVTTPATRYYKTVHDWQPALLTEAEAAKLKAPAVPEVPIDAVDTPRDRTDDALLKALAEDGRRTFDQLAQIAGVSETTARRRVEALRNEGRTLIRAVVAPAHVGLPVEALLWLRVAPKAVHEVGTVLAKSANVRGVSTLLGEYQILSDVTMPSVDALHEFVTCAGWSDMVLGMENSLVVDAPKRSGLVNA